MNDEGNNNPSIGAVFLPVGGGDTYQLKDITVSADGDFMTPTEYLQVLDPNGAYVTARYTYVSEDYLKDEYEDEWEDYKGLLGWWERGHVGEAGYNRDTTEVSVGAAFLGRLDGNGLNFTSAGAVPGEATSISDEGNNNPYFINYLPVTITLGQITVSGDDDSVFMTPTEYLQVLDPNGAYVTARYTYISKEYLDDEYEEEAPSYYSLIGWWERGHVGEEGYNRNNVELKPGFGFLGRLDGNGLKFNFPAAYTK